MPLCAILAPGDVAGKIRVAIIKKRPVTKGSTAQFKVMPLVRQPWSGTRSTSVAAVARKCIFIMDQIKELWC